MAADTRATGVHDTDFPAHATGYDRFIKLLKWSVVIVAIIAAAVIYIIAN